MDDSPRSRNKSLTAPNEIISNIFISTIIAVMQFNGRYKPNKSKL